MDEGLTRVFKKEVAKASLGTKIIGKKVYAYDLVTSTNDLAHFLAQSGEPEGSVFFAKGQAQGRGRLGGGWSSPYGKGLYFSFILRPGMLIREVSRLTPTVALSVAHGLEEAHVPGVSIKWPNDIYIKDSKAGGILTEMSLDETRINYVVCGVGINVNASKVELPQGATSLKEVCGHSFDIADLSHIIMRRLDDAYGLLMAGGFPEIIMAVKERSWLILGGRVRVIWGEKEMEGYAVDFDEYGGLVLRRDNGLLEKIYSGHVVKIG